MNKKVATVCCLLVVLMLFPIVGYKIFTDREYQGNTTNAQDTSGIEDLRGVWIASVNNIDFPSKPGLSAEKQKAELDKIVENAEYMGLNAIFFQVRPTGDALYKSSVFPWSAYLTGKQGKANDSEFDPLAYIIEKAHKKGIQLHAWINPLRLSMGTTRKPDKDVNVLSTDHPARNIPNAVVAASTGQLYLDPGCPEAIKLITDGVAEIVKNYDVDGIHFDDYFYPSKAETNKDFNDGATYQKYKGTFQNKDDWRRNNINTLVKNTYDTVKSLKPDVQFGISPFAIWSNKDRNNEGSDTKGGISTYYDHFADSRQWVKDGYLDYIAPQIYWNIGFKAADYSVLLDWWKNVCSGTKVKLYVGQAAYKINDTTQANEWLDPLQIPKQIALNRKSKAVSGSIFYGYAQLKQNVLGIKDKLHGIFVTGRDPGGAVPEDRQLYIAVPGNGYKTSSSKVSILGSSDPDQPVYLNGNVINASENGYFTYYADLKVGENTFVFKHKNKETLLKVTRKASAASDVYVMTKPEFKPGSISPTQSMTMQTGQEVTFSCKAPAGAKVWVEIGKYKVNLTNSDSTNGSSSGNTLTPVRYTGTFTFPVVTGKARELNLGNPVYVLEYNGNRVTSRQSNTFSVQSAKYNKYAIVSSPDSEIVARSGPSKEYSRVTPLINGAVDYVVGQQNGYYLLKSGVWTNNSNVKIVNATLKTNRISAINVNENGSYTDITFKMPINAVFDVAADSNEVKLTLFNTKGMSFTTAPGSSVYSSVTYKDDGGNAQYTFKLRSADNYFGYYVQYKNNSLVFSLKNAPKISKNSSSKPLEGLKVLIDAGHGGRESGAIGPSGQYGFYEKQINLSIALNTRKYLKALGATVIMTRTGDTTVSLDARADLIRKEKPDIAVSIHNNSMDASADYSKNTGLLVLYSKDSSKAAAGFIKNVLVTDLQRKDDGYRWQSLSVCTVTPSPAILIEGGFMSNPAEYQWLSDYDNQVKIANSIGKAIEKWADKFTR